MIEREGPESDTIEMNTEYAIYAVVAFFAILTTIQGTLALIDGFAFLRYVSGASSGMGAGRGAHGQPLYQPKATVILPCRGIDQKLQQTVAALGQQNYDDYEVVFALESTTDAAHAAIKEWTQAWESPRHRILVAGLAKHSSQKIHNLLAALATLPDDREAIAFLDSDVVPAENWLACLVAPLQDPEVGASTGFRWYTATGGLVSGIRSAWNAASVSMLHNDKTSFCWGGSTAILRRTFERLEVARLWSRALSDDYVLTHAIRGAGLGIRFVPSALIPADDRTTLREFLTFARRQLVITRVCEPKLWLAGLLLSMNFINGVSCASFLWVSAAFGLIGDRVTLIAAVGVWVFLLSLAAGKALVRQVAVRRVLCPPVVGWRDFAWDVIGVALVGVIHFALLLSALTSRRFTWRHTVYEMVSPTETRLLGRLDVGATPASEPGASPPCS